MIVTEEIQLFENGLFHKTSTQLSKLLFKPLLKIDMPVFYVGGHEEMGPFRPHRIKFSDGSIFNYTWERWE